MALTADTLAERILAVIENTDMTRRELAEAIGLDPTALSKALSGKRNFKSLEIALIAEALKVPVQVLLAEDDEDVPAFLAARVQPNANPAVEQAWARARTMLELDKLLAELGDPATPPFRRKQLGQMKPYEQGERLANSVRADLGAESADLPTEVASLAAYIEEKLNIDVAIEPLADGLDGLAIARQPFRLIMVSSSLPATRQRYTIAHELGHLMAGDGKEVIDEDVLASKSPSEARANAFAAAFLMPAAALKVAFEGQTSVSEQLIADLLSRYRVSLDALAFRLHNVGLVDGVGRDQVRRMSSARISLRQGRALDLQARKDRRWPALLLERAIKAYVRGHISIRPLANLVEMDPDELLMELAPPQFGPGELASDARDDDLVPML